MKSSIALHVSCVGVCAFVDENLDHVSDARKICGFNKCLVEFSAEVCAGIGGDGQESAGEPTEINIWDMVMADSLDEKALLLRHGLASVFF